MIATTTLTARTMRPEETLPASLLDGVTDMIGLSNTDWIWVVEDGGTTVGVLIAVPCNRIAILLRLKTSADAPVSSLVVLLRQAFSDMRSRGVTGFITFLSPEQMNEKRLMRLVKRIGGVILYHSLFAVGSPLPPEGM